MTSLVQAEVDGETLTDEEISAFFVLLSVAGNDTTRNTISHTMWALQDHPDQRQYLLEDFDARIMTATEEFVRWASPVLTFKRTVVENTTLDGVDLAAGEKVVMFYESGHRDAAVFENPSAFDVSRAPNKHLGFGGGGPHFCMGASLAKAAACHRRRAAAPGARPAPRRARLPGQQLRARRQVHAVHRPSLTAVVFPSQNVTWAPQTWRSGRGRGERTRPLGTVIATT